MRAMIETSWIWRRTTVFGTLGFCAWAVGYLTIWGADTALAREIATSLILLAGTVIGSYVFGATWDDLNRMRHGRMDRPPPRARPEDYPPAEDGRV